MVEKHVRLSRFLSWVLRHDPGRLGLELDRCGWADISKLIECARRGNVHLTREVLFEIVETDAKARYQLSYDLTRIRALYGHSVDVDLGLAPKKPPRLLYHGTAARFLDAIMKHGISPGKRQFVHLCADPQTAMQVGARHGRPVILVVDSGLMYNEGIELYRSTRETWLVRAVPAKFIRILEHS
jgi:putative RNA 2'-phosphotransferase